VPCRRHRRREVAGRPQRARGSRRRLRPPELGRSRREGIMNWRLATSALLLSVAVSGATAQPSAQPDPLLKLNEWRPKVQALIDSARGEGLPWGSLRLKAIEGINKKYNGKAILEALRKYYRALEQSRAALGPMASDEEIET